MDNAKTGNKGNKKLIAGVAASLLFVGVAGGTFALWNDSATDEGSTITNGNLDLTLNGAEVWTDVAPANGSDARLITDIANERLSPGDVLQGDYALQGALEGDNIEAEFRFQSAATADGADLPEGITVSYELIDSAGESIGTVDDGAVVHAVSPEYVENYGNPKGALILPNTVDEATANYTVRANVAFDSAISDRVSVQKSFTLDGFGVELVQVDAANTNA